MKERDVESYLVKKVLQLGGEVRKVQWIGRRGAPDRFVLLPRGCWWIELKRPLTGRVAAHQTRELQRLQQHGQLVAVLCSKEAIDLWLAHAA